MSTEIELFVALQRVLPKHFLSRLVAKAAESEASWLKNLLIKRAISAFNIDMSEAADQSLDAYPTFNAFFTRALKEGVRPIADTPGGLVSPADGAVSQAGSIEKGNLIQAKGIYYSAERLLGCAEQAGKVNGGEFTTIYLSPRDYHRVHIPCDGKLLRTRYIPGELFSVNDKTAKGLPNLFARNERLVCEFETENGPMMLVFVGAMLVAGIESVWDGFYSPNPATVQDKDFSDQDIRFAKGEEIGRFKFGSTVILLFPKDQMSWEKIMEEGQPLQMGQLIGKTKSAE